MAIWMPQLKLHVTGTITYMCTYCTFCFRCVCGRFYSSEGGGLDVGGIPPSNPFPKPKP